MQKEETGDDILVSAAHAITYGIIKTPRWFNEKRLLEVQHHRRRNNQNEYTAHNHYKSDVKT